MAKRPLLPVFALALPVALSGCIAKTAVDVVTAPVRLAGSAVDAATTSQSEADEKRGREMRQREERLGELDRQYRRHSRECNRGDEDGCEKAREDYEEMESLRRY